MSIDDPFRPVTDEDIALGEAAKWLLSQPQFQAAMKALEQNYIDQTFNSRPEDAELRQQAYYAEMGRRTIELQLQQWVTLAARAIADEQEETE